MHVADDQIACGYVRKAGDIAELARDWFNVASGEPLCKACRDVIQPDPDRRAPEGSETLSALPPVRWRGAVTRGYRATAASAVRSWASSASARAAPKCSNEADHY